MKCFLTAVSILLIDIAIFAIVFGIAMLLPEKQKEPAELNKKQDNHAEYYYDNVIRNPMNPISPFRHMMKTY